jgi:hypothetical protein
VHRPEDLNARFVFLDKSGQLVRIKIKVGRDYGVAGIAKETGGT